MRAGLKCSSCSCAKLFWGGSIFKLMWDDRGESESERKWTLGKQPYGATLKIILKICIQKMEEMSEGIPQKTSENLFETTPQSHLWSKLYSVTTNAGLPAEINSSVMKSMWRPLSSQLQSVQALLPTQCMLGAHFVSRLCGRDVNLGVLSGALSCPNIKTQPFITWRKLHKLILSILACSGKTSCFW